MPIDRSLFSRNINKEFIPDWHCPSCARGYLDLVHRSFREVVLKTNLKGDGEIYLYSKFTFFLKCSNKKCYEVATCSGDGIRESFEDEEGNFQLSTTYNIRYMDPSPHIVEIKHIYPEYVSKYLRTIFFFYWSSPDVSVQKIRTAFEEIINRLIISTKNTKNDGKTKFDSMNSRIDILCKIISPDSSKIIREMGHALREIGNRATHVSSDLTKNDFFNVLEIFEILLNEIFNDDNRSPSVHKSKNNDKPNEFMIVNPEVRPFGLLGFKG